MSIAGNYEKYRDNNMGTLTEPEYNTYLNGVRTRLGELINSDPTNHMSDIGRIIFHHLKEDLDSGVAFSRVSKGLNTRAKHSWFIYECPQVILRYIQQGAGYSDYMKDGGWQDILITGAKLAGVALTVTASVKAAQHASRIPPDEPTKTQESECDDNEIPIDHPEVTKARIWTAVAISSGAITLGAIVGHGYHYLLKDIHLDIFFSLTENEIISYSKTNIALKIISPGFHSWKKARLKENLASNPPNWQQHPELCTMVCPISGEFMLFPVKDKCGHYFDYRSLRAYQLNPATQNPLECPVSTTQPNIGLSQIKFDKAKFDAAQILIRTQTQISASS